MLLPAALVLNSRGGIVTLVREAMHTPTVVEGSAAQDHAGARWRLARLTQLPGDLPETVAVVAEFAATVEDAERLRSALPCDVALTDMQGRRWTQVFLADRAVREARPDLADMPRCGAFDTVADGDTITMAASFLVPANAGKLALSLSLAGGAPDSLLFR